MYKIIRIRVHGSLYDENVVHEQFAKTLNEELFLVW